MVTQLHVDQQAQQNRLGGGGVARLKETLCGELGTSDLRMRLSGRSIWLASLSVAGISRTFGLC
jgi:hypothetical protein